MRKADEERRRIRLVEDGLSGYRRYLERKSAGWKEDPPYSVFWESAARPDSEKGKRERILKRLLWLPRVLAGVFTVVAVVLLAQNGGAGMSRLISALAGDPVRGVLAESWRMLTAFGPASYGAPLAVILAVLALTAFDRISLKT